MRCTALTLILTLTLASVGWGMSITSSPTAPIDSDILLSFDTSAVNNSTFFTIARGGGSSGTGGGESAYGQTFRLDHEVILEKITIKTRLTEDIGGQPFLLWFGQGFTGATDSGLSSLMLEAQANLPANLSGVGETSYLTFDFAAQSLEAQRTYAFLPRFASGGAGGVHAEAELGFMGAYSYADGAAFDLNYSTILNNELVFYLHGRRLLNGDFDNDGTLTSNDIDLLSIAVATGNNPPEFDLNQDTRVDPLDRDVWIKELVGTWVGDATLDGEFNSADLIVVLAAGQYEDELEDNSGWATGDFDGDADFNSGDLVAALADGGYEQGPRAATMAIPEPSGPGLLVCGAPALAALAD